MSTPKGAALVTGGAKRIGAAIATALARHGYDVALHYHTSAEAAERTARDIEDCGRRCRLFRCDLNDHDETAALVPRVREQFPRLNVLVNNASVFESATLRDTGRDLFERHFNIHFKAPFFLTQAFAEACSDGHVVNILDTRVRGSDPRHAAYTLSKKALLELTRMAARELGPAVRVNAVAPGMILPPPGGVVDELERRSAGLPLKRIGDTANVVAAVLFLIDNPFITGECVYVDGGEHL
ncbi:MAG: SDR family oxidoreductase [Deltaproteobacteria bacterium]|nr:SDR family oxidoreductase [Deltaproteobacteria bacterium]